MTLQKIKSPDGKEEYVLLPVAVYRALRRQIEGELVGRENKEEYEPFIIEDYVDNPVALARIKARVTQEELARRMKVSQAYISKIERRDKITPKQMTKVITALGDAIVPAASSTGRRKPSLKRARCRRR